MQPRVEGERPPARKAWAAMEARVAQAVQEEQVARAVAAWAAAG